MKRVLAIIGTAILLFGASACGEKKPPEPGAYQGKKILSVVRDLAQAYEKRDLDGFMDLIAKGYEGREAFEGSIGRVFSKYDSVRFCLTVGTSRRPSTGTANGARPKAVF